MNMKTLSFLKSKKKNINVPPRKLRLQYTRRSQAVARQWRQNDVDLAGVTGFYPGRAVSRTSPAARDKAEQKHGRVRRHILLRRGHRCWSLPL